MKEASRTRLRQLDILRGVAILLVIANHLAGRIPLTKLTAPIWAVHNVGWTGVDLFFVLSGFLVSGLIYQEQLKTGDFRLRRFFVRRGLKIYPAFYVFLLLTGLLVPSWTDFSHPSPGSWLSEAFFVQNYGHRMWQHTWSLAVEEHFYLLIAVTMFLMVRFDRERPFRWMPVLFIATAPVVLGLRVWNVLAARNLAAANLWQTHLRLDALLFGVTIAYYYHNYRSATERVVHRYGWPIFLLSIVFISPAIFWRTNLFMDTVGFTCLYLGFGGITMLAVTGWLRAPGSLKFLLSLFAWIGVYSYSIYLWHLPARVGIRLVGAKLLGGGNKALALEALAYVLTAVCFGVLMAKVIEFPVLRIRDRILPPPARAVPEVVSSEQSRPHPDPARSRLHEAAFAPDAAL